MKRTLLSTFPLFACARAYRPLGYEGSTERLVVFEEEDKNFIARARVSGVIIAADYDNKLEYALKVLPNIQVFLYKVSFTLDEFKGK